MLNSKFVVYNCHK